MKAMLLFIPLLALALTHAATASDRPNILWITSEDNSANWLGCYGRSEARTPRLDALAAEGLRFTHAYANAAVCAVARSTLLNGAHAVSQGTQHMRSRHPIPPSFKAYVTHLREAGYHCTNNSKTDYNFKGNDAALWDACSTKAHYRKRPAGKPFLAVFNLTISHESNLFPEVAAANRRKGLIPQVPRLDPAKITVPAYLPDLPEIRSDIALYQDHITALDTQVGALLDELDREGLADDTIVIYHSDHGGVIPRGKRYLEDSGVRVPLIVRIPPRWRHLAPFAAGKTVDEPVSFVDIAPTLLSLAGISGPTGRMQGRAFLGSHRTPPAEDAVVFLYADRFDELHGMRRGITDGRWKYIRCFTPSIPAAPCSHYCFGQAGWSAWRKAWQDGRLDGAAHAMWEAPQPVERLFDTQADPDEVHNLAHDPAHAERLSAMRVRLRGEMIRHGDTGVVPEAMFATLAAKSTIADYIAAHQKSLPRWVDLAFRASSATEADLTALVDGLGSEDPLIRYGSLQGCLQLGRGAAPAIDRIRAMLQDTHPLIRIDACRVLWAAGLKQEANQALIAQLDQPLPEPARLGLLQALSLHDALGQIPAAWIHATLADPRAGEYPKRLAKRLRDERRTSDERQPQQSDP